MKNLLLLSVFILTLFIGTSKADLLNCDDKLLTSLSEISSIGPKVASSEETGDKVSNLFMQWGCQFKKGAAKFGESVKENAKKLNENVKVGVQKLKEKAKDLGSDIETKYHDIKHRLSHDSDETVTNDRKFFLENVEIINPDLLKADQECGHGHILDSLGNCRKLRK